MNHRTATGCDGIPPRFLKLCSSLITTPLTHIINRSLTESKIPALWKKANVTPIHKGGTTEPSNYRPISVLPAASKILERVFMLQLTAHLTTLSLLSPFQSGFRPGYSTSDVILYVSDLWRKAIDNGLVTGEVFLDLSKAFDCVVHSILLAKLPYYGIRGSSLAWLTNYLQDRHQRVFVHNVYSEWGRITHGVPQGSVLGPLLFCLHINDLSSCIQNCKIHMFADDTSIQCSSSSVVDIEHSLQKDLNAVQAWMNANKLKLNLAKTFVMLIGTRQRVCAQRVKLVVDDRLIEQVSTTKYLGVKIDSYLSWEQHIDFIVSKARSKLFAIRRMMPLPKNVMETLYKSLVQPLLDYCDVAWSPGALKQVDKLERVQKLAARIVLGAPSTARTVELYKTLNWSTLDQRRRYHTATYVFKVLNGLSPPYLQNTFELSVHKTKRCLRNSYRIYIPFVRTTIAKNSFYYQGAALWNSLDQSLYSSTTLATFKSRYSSLYFP